MPRTRRAAPAQFSAWTVAALVLGAASLAGLYSLSTVHALDMLYPARPITLLSATSLSVERSGIPCPSGSPQAPAQE